MLKQLCIVFLYLIAFSAESNGQWIDAGPGYQMVLMNNPALSGGEGDGVLRLSYLNFYPGNSYNLHSVYLSYDSYFPVLHGGAGLFISEDYHGGIVNDLKGGFSYAYHLQAGDNLFINAGLSASLLHRGYNFNKAVFPDQIDPLGGVVFPSAESLANTGHSVFDVGAGFLFMSGKVFGGFSVNHLAEPDLSGSGISYEKLKRKYFIHVSADMNLSNTLNLKVRPTGFMSIQGDYLSGGAGGVLESNYLSVNVLAIASNFNTLNLQSGFSLKSGKMAVFYNYQFNVIKGNNLFPLSLLHQVGLAFSLKNVDKRKTINTINFPKL